MDKTDIIHFDEVPLEMESNTSPWTELYQDEQPASKTDAATASRAPQSPASARQEQMDHMDQTDSDPDDALSLMFYS